MSKTCQQLWIELRQQISNKEFHDLCTPIAQEHSTLSNEPLHCLMSNVIRIILDECTSYRRKEEDKQLEFIRMLNAIINTDADYSTDESHNVINLSRFNSAEESTIQFIFNTYPADSQGAPLPMPENISVYGNVAKTILHRAVVFLFALFTELLSKQSLNDTQKNIQLEMKNMAVEHDSFSAQLNLYSANPPTGNHLSIPLR